MKMYEQKCLNYKKYFSIRNNNFFQDLNIPLRDVFKIILYYISKMPRYSIINYMNYSRLTIEKIIKKIVKRIPEPDFSSNKIGGMGKIIQVAETMLNYKVESHRERSPGNKTDALCIIEFENEIKRVFATIIRDQKELTIVPSIYSQVASNSTIWTE
ncbi:hypothetical protein DMUE_0925 [Dictyocoela muelleri]|nr:hypothetical protein DMUE_0925 [Dictyocoela muelleri]